MDYEVFIDGKKLAASISGVQATDRQGAQADDIRLLILNGAELEVERGSVLKLSFGGFSSGDMNIDGISSNSTNTQIVAVSVPLSAKEKHTRHWYKVMLFDIVNDMAVNLGMSVYYYGVENYYYENVTQFNETDLAFLNRLCSREGYSLKLDNNRLVIYNNEVIARAKAVKSIGQSDILEGRISFSESPNKVKAVTVKYFNGERLISHTAKRVGGGESIIIKEYVSNDSEAERFAKGYLNAYAQGDTTVDCLIPITDGIAAGNVIEFTDWAMFNGRYVIFECCHDPEKNKTRLRGRKV